MLLVFVSLQYEKTVAILLLELYDAIKWMLCLTFLSVLVMPSKEKDYRKVWTGSKVQRMLLCICSLFLFDSLHFIFIF